MAKLNTTELFQLPIEEFEISEANQVNNNLNPSIPSFPSSPSSTISSLNIPLNTSSSSPSPSSSSSSSASSDLHIAINNSIRILKEIIPHTFQQSLLFTVEKNGRYVVKTTAIKYFKIFPWFHLNPDNRYKETINNNEYITIDKILNDINFFWSKRGQDYNETDIKIYQKVCHEILQQEKILALSTIHLFTIQFEKMNLERAIEGYANTNNQINNIQHTVNVHEQRIANLEEEIKKIKFDSSQPGAKRIREGRDRAVWMKIRDEDLPTREEWCVEGGVFGLYSDGIGPLLPNHIRPRKSVVVYSTDPDTIEAHPDPSHPEKYARIVLIGEAPVHLRLNEYIKLKRLKCHVDIYVNHMGEVCVRDVNKDRANEGMVFATTDWSDNYATDNEGYPVFQGVRGVCAKITDMHQYVHQSTGLFRFVHDISSSLPSLQPLTEMKQLKKLLKKREMLNNQYGELEAGHEVYQFCKTHRTVLEQGLRKNEELLQTYHLHLSLIPRYEARLNPTNELYTKLIETLTSSNRSIQEEIHRLDSQTSFRIETYEADKQKLENELRNVRLALKNIRG